MEWAQVFQVVNTAALLGWIGLLVLPRYPKFLTFLQRGLIGAFCLFYAVVVAMFFFRVEGGGFNSLEQVKTLFSSDAVVVAGWVHYLAFDMFVGLWVAQRADQRGIHRILQIPILFLTFMFGPVGLLLFYVVEGAMAMAGKRSASEGTVAT